MRSERNDKNLGDSVASFTLNVQNTDQDSWQDLSTYFDFDK